MVRWGRTRWAILGLLGGFLLCAVPAAAQTYWIGDTWRHDKEPAGSIPSHGYAFEPEPPAEGRVHTPPNGFLHWELPTWVTLREPPNVELYLQCRAGYWGTPLPQGASVTLFLSGPDNETVLSGSASGTGGVCDERVPAHFSFALDERYEPGLRLPPGEYRFRLTPPLEWTADPAFNGTWVLVGPERSRFHLDGLTGWHAAPVVAAHSFNETKGIAAERAPAEGDRANIEVSVEVQGGYFHVRILDGDRLVVERNVTASAGNSTTWNWTRRVPTTSGEVSLHAVMDVEAASYEWRAHAMRSPWLPEQVHSYPTDVPLASTLWAPEPVKMHLRPSDDGLTLSPHPTTGLHTVHRERVPVRWTTSPQTLSGNLTAHLVFICPTDGTLDALYEIPLAYHRTWPTYLSVGEMHLAGTTLPMEREICRKGDMVQVDLAMDVDGVRMPGGRALLDIGIPLFLGGPRSPMDPVPTLDLDLGASWIEWAAMEGHHWQAQERPVQNDRAVVWTDAPFAELRIEGPPGAFSVHDGLRPLWDGALEEGGVAAVFELEEPVRWEVTAPAGTMVRLHPAADLLEVPVDVRRTADRENVPGADAPAAGLLLAWAALGFASLIRRNIRA